MNLRGVFPFEFPGDSHVTEKILFVDDELETLHSFRRLLHGRFEIETALGGEEALTSIRNRGPFAVVISDVQMPGMDGIRFLSRVRQVAPNTVRLVLTGHADLDTAVHAVNEGHIFQFLTKPCDEALLTDAIKEAIAYHRGRRERRIELDLPLLLYRSAAHEKAETVHTRDISSSGARLTGIRSSLHPGDKIILQYNDRKAAFQVIWAGSRNSNTEGEVGVRCLTPEAKIWGQKLAQWEGNGPLQRDMAVARSVQARLLPVHQPPIPTLDYAGRCLQARTVGGDYYDFLDLGPGRLGLVLADIAGKGVSAAILMANLHGIVRSQFTAESTGLAHALILVNRLFYRHTETHRYATLFLASYDDATRKLRYINCGHNPPILLRRQTVERLPATATVLGLFQNWECSVAEVLLEAGDLLAIYTDGITEATAANGEEFGEARLLALLEQNRHLEPSAILQAVEHAVQQFRSGEQADDLTLVIARAR